MNKTTSLVALGAFLVGCTASPSAVETESAGAELASSTRMDPAQFEADLQEIRGKFVGQPACSLHVYGGSGSVTITGDNETDGASVGLSVSRDTVVFRQQASVNEDSITVYNVLGQGTLRLVRIADGPLVLVVREVREAWTRQFSCVAR